MSKAPNQTEAEYARQVELQNLRDTRELTAQELYELRDLTRIGISHLQFTKVEKI